VDQDLLPLLIRIGGAVALVTIVGTLAARRILFLYGLVRVARPQPERVTRQAILGNLKYLLIKVLGQKKLLRWSVPGIAHAFVFWAFLVVQTTLLEAALELINPAWHLPLLNSIAIGGVTAYDVLGFTQDSFMLLTTAGVVVLSNVPALFTQVVTRLPGRPRSGSRIPLRRPSVT
jgi:hypothetical protein